MEAAISSGIPEMSRFDALSDEDKAYIIARWRTRDKMAAWEKHEQERKAGKGGQRAEEWE